MTYGTYFGAERGVRGSAVSAVSPLTHSGRQHRVPAAVLVTVSGMRELTGAGRRDLQQLLALFGRMAHEVHTARRLAGVGDGLGGGHRQQLAVAINEGAGPAG